MIAIYIHSYTVMILYSLSETLERQQIGIVTIGIGKYLVYSASRLCRSFYDIICNPKIWHLVQY